MLLKIIQFIVTIVTGVTTTTNNHSGCKHSTYGIALVGCHGDCYCYDNRPWMIVIKTLTFIKL